MKLLKHKYIHEFLEHSAEIYPGKIALIHEEVRATYAEINAKANALAQYLIDIKVKPGDRVVMILENSLDYVVSYYGILKTGAGVVPLSTDLKPDGLNLLLAELEPAALITNKRFDRLIKATDQNLLKSINLLNLSNNPTNPINKTKNLKLKIKNCSLACIIYTSGSTGKPKGVMLSHANIVANVDSICQYLELSHMDIQMVVLPFFYVMGKSLLNTHFAVGGTVVVNNKFAFPASVLQQMVEENVTGFSGVPSTYAYLLHRSPLKKYRHKLTALRYCTQAGGHMARQIKNTLPEALPPHTKLYIMYGATEAGARLTYLNPERYGDKIDSIGKAIPNVSVSIVDSDGRRVRNEEQGELVASGPNIFMGYWRDKIATEKALDRLGYHTGDTAYQDSEEFIYIKGRKDDLIKVGGHRINPQEIEDAILATNIVVEAAVIGVPDNLLGNKLIAIVATKNDDITAQMILAESRKRLPKYKMPESVRIARTLPKHASGKVNKKKCLEFVLNRQ